MIYLQNMIIVLQLPPNCAFYYRCQSAMSNLFLIREIFLFLIENSDADISNIPIKADYYELRVAHLLLIQIIFWIYNLYIFLNMY